MAEITSSIELVTGMRGEPHVTSNQAGMANASYIGQGAQVADGILGGFALAIDPTYTSATMSNGVAFADGRQVVLEQQCTIGLEGGSQGNKRHDLICIRYELSEGIEEASVQYFVGTPAASPQDPEINDGSIIDGDTTVDIPLWRLVWDDLTCTAQHVFALRRPFASLTEDGGQNALVGADGIIRPIPSIVKLWENSSPEAEYSSGTIAANCAGYDLVIITFACRLTTTSDKTEPLTMVLDSHRFNKQEQALAWNYGASQSVRTWVACRYITINTNSETKNITVAACNWKYADGGPSSGSTTTNHLIPQSVIGVKLG